MSRSYTRSAKIRLTIDYAHVANVLRVRRELGVSESFRTVRQEAAA
jgi:hypothetical protein